MKVVPIVYVTNMERSLAWYRMLLPEAELLSTSPYWSELSLGKEASLALHVGGEANPGNQMSLALEADRSLEEITDMLTGSGIGIDRGIADEAFGRSVAVTDPDGLVIQINEHNREQYPG